MEGKIMNVTVKAIHFEAKASLEEFIQKKIVKLEQYSDKITSADVTMQVVKPETSDNKEVKPADVNMYIRQQPNTKWFNLIKTQLYIYNISGRDTTKWVNRALRRVGDAPVIFNSYETERSRQEVEKAVRNLGYMGATVDVGTKLAGKKKIKLSYDVHTGKAYKVRSIQYDIPDTTIWNYVPRKE